MGRAFDAERMKRLRRSMNLRGRGLARLAQCDPQIIEQIEAGTIQPDAELADRIAKVLGAQPESLYMWIDDSQPKKAECGTVLTAEEEQIIQAFRRMSPEARAKAWGFVMGLAVNGVSAPGEN